MATSGSTNFTQTKSDVINDAFQNIGVYGLGRTISSEDFNFASNTLNKMIKAWGSQGLHLWTREENTLFLTKDQASYTLGSTANACLASDAIITRLNGVLAASATSVTVDSTTGMTVGDYIGIVLTSTAVHYTTIATIPTSTTLTLTSGITTAASDNAEVYTFTTKISKPLRILGCRRAQGIDDGATTSLTEVEMAEIAYHDYMNLPSKTNSGIPNQFAYDPKNTTGILYVWQRPTSGIYRLNFTSERMIEDLDAVGDNFDFPSEWLEPITWQLSLRLCPAFGKDQKMINSIAPMAQSMLQNLLDWDSEVNSVSLQPDIGT